jgi:hypothetical protein
MDTDKHPVYKEKNNRQRTSIYIMINISSRKYVNKATEYKPKLYCSFIK